MSQAAVLFQCTTFVRWMQKMYDFLHHLATEEITNLTKRHAAVAFETIHVRCLSIFTMRRSCASAVLGVVILSVCLSICHTRALWLIQRTYPRYFYTTWKGNPSSLLPPNSGWWATSPSPLMGDRSDPPLQKSLRGNFQRQSCSTFIHLSNGT